MKHFEVATLLAGTQMVRCRSRPVEMKRVDLLQGLGAKHYLKSTAINGRVDLSSAIMLPSTRAHISNLEAFTIHWDGGMNQIAQGLFPEVMLTLESTGGIDISDSFFNLGSEGRYLVAST